MNEETLSKYSVKEKCSLFCLESIGDLVEKIAIECLLQDQPVQIQDFIAFLSEAIFYHFQDHQDISEKDLTTHWITYLISRKILKKVKEINQSCSVEEASQEIKEKVRLNLIELLVPNLFLGITSISTNNEIKAQATQVIFYFINVYASLIEKTPLQAFSEIDTLMEKVLEFLQRDSE